jgi:tagatose-1,6-bisphosphate aldolase
MTEFAINHHLSQCATAGGMFSVLAIDHRDNLMEEMSRTRGRPVGAGEVVAFKQAAIRHLGGVCSAVLTDPDFGFPALVDSGVTANFGLLAPLEVTDYTVHPSRRKTALIENWGVEKIKQSGCSGAKLLLYYHPEADNAASQTELVDRIAAQCRRHAVPFFLEPIAYSLDPEVPLGSEELAQIVIETARHFSPRGVDVLKVQFPLHPSADESSWVPVLRRLNEACTVPWALLSAGVSFDLFLNQAAAACKAGTSGVIVGRAIWAEGMALEEDALDLFMRTTARSRMLALTSVCELYGTPWHRRSGRPRLGENWYHPAT